MLILKSFYEIPNGTENIIPEITATLKIEII